MEFFDNARDIAEFLLEEEGAERALETAFAGIARAHANRDYYLLSVWREVRIVLRNRQDTVREMEQESSR
jgi:hypothetical protein